MSTPEIEISCAAVKQKIDGGDGFVLIDCREQNEYDLVKIEGAQLLPMSELETRHSELEEHKDSSIVIHCHHGGRSLRVANWLRQQGYSSAQSMAGGIDVWAQEIEPGMERY